MSTPIASNNIIDPWDNDEGWSDITPQISTTFQNMSPGQLIHPPNYQGVIAMNGWIMMDPKLDPDALSAPLRVNSLLALDITPTSPTLPQTLSIVNYYFSQIQGFLSGSPLFACMAASLYTLKYREIQCPLLKLFTQLLLKISRSLYDTIVASDIAQDDEFHDCYPSQLKEIDWCEDMGPDEVIYTSVKQIAELQTYIDLLLSLFKSAQSYLITTNDANSFNTDCQLIGDYGKTVTVGDSGVEKGPNDSKIDQIIDSLKQNTIYTTLTSDPSTSSYSLIDHYVVVNQLLARLCYFQSFYMVLLSLTPLSKMKLPDYSINTINYNSQGIVDGLTNALNMVWIYNQHIKPSGTFFEKEILVVKSDEKSQKIVNGEIVQKKNTNDGDEATNGAEIAEAAQLAEKVPEITPPTLSLFAELYIQSHTVTFSIPEMPFLSRIAPEPSQIQKKFNFDPFSTYLSPEKFHNIRYDHPNIIDDVTTPLAANFTPSPSQILLSAILPSPTYGLFPHVLAMATTPHMMMRPFEYPSPAVSIESITINISKLISLLSGLVSILPAKQQVLPQVEVIEPVVEKVVVQNNAKQQQQKKNNNNNNNNKNTKTTQPTSQQPQQPTQAPFHTHIPSYAHIPQLQPFLTLTITVDDSAKLVANTLKTAPKSIKTSKSTQLLLPPPLSPYMAYFSLSEQILFILQGFSNLHPSTFVRALGQRLAGNQLDYFGVGRIDAHSEYFVKSKAPSLQGYVELPPPAKSLQIYDDQYVNADDIIAAELGTKNNTNTVVVANNGANPNAKNAKSNAKNVNQTHTQTPQTTKVTNAAKKAAITKNQKMVKQISQSDDDEYWMGHRSPRLNQGQMYVLQFTQIFQEWCNTYYLHPSRQKRHFIAQLSSLNNAQQESETYDNTEYVPAMKSAGLYPFYSILQDPASVGLRGSSVTCGYPLYAATTLMLLEQIALALINTIQLGMVTHKEWFIYLYFLDYIFENYNSITMHSRYVGVKEGHASTGTLKGSINYHYISYNTQTHFIENKNNGFFDMTLPLHPNISSESTPPGNLWTLPRLVTSAQTYGNLRYLPQPIITSNTSMKKKLVKFSAADNAAFQHSFPPNDTNTVQYKQPIYTPSTAHWVFPQSKVEDVKVTNTATVNASNNNKNVKNNQKPAPKVTSAQQTTPSRPVAVPSGTPLLPDLVHPPKHPMHLMMGIYGDLSNLQFTLLIIAKMLNFTIPQHILLNTLKYDLNTTSFALESLSDQILLEKYISNRFSSLYRTYFPTAQTFQLFLDKLNKQANAGIKTLLSNVSQRTKDLKHSIAQFISLYHCPLGVDGVDNQGNGVILSYPTQRDLVQISRYDNIPCNTVFTESNKSSTTHPSFNSALPTVPTLGLIDTYTLQCNSIIDHINTSITPFLFYLIKVNNNKAAPGKVALRFPTMLDVDNTFVSIFPDISFNEVALE